MTSTMHTDAEQGRLAALHRLHALDQPRRVDLDSIARLAAHLCGASSAAVNLVDADRQFSAAAYGWQPVDIPRCDALCSVAIQSRDVSVTRNAGIDARWIGNPLTTGDNPLIRFYAAAPLIVSDGAVVGTLCAFDDDERELDRSQVERLRDLAALTVELLELRVETDRLGTAALRDPLTGLPNRTLLGESLAHSLSRTQRGVPAPVVVFADVNGFKGVNDTYGHAAGDALLCSVAERLVSTVRGSDIASRLGGDEFVLVCESVDGHPSDPQQIIARVRDAFTEPVSMLLAGTVASISIGVSLGAVTAQPGESVHDVLLRADAAMYSDKQACKTRRQADRQLHMGPAATTA